MTTVVYEIQRDPERRSGQPPPDVLNPGEEAVLREIRDLLAGLERLTKELCAQKTTTLSKCIPSIRTLRTVSAMSFFRSSIRRQQAYLRHISQVERSMLM